MSKKFLSIDRIARIGVLSALAVILMLLEIPLPFLPPFYKIDFSEVVVLLGGFSLGPLSAMLIEGFKILLFMLFKPTETAFVGELANFIIGCSSTVPAAFIYQKHKTQKQAIVGMTVGTLIMIIVGGIMNAFVLLPTYAAVFHLPIEELIAMGTSVNASINSLTTFVLFATTSLNLIKGVVCSGIVFVIYKRVSPFLKIKNH